MPIPQLRLRRYVRAGKHCYIARVTFEPGRLPSLHTHNFAEVFWVERGNGQHLINGQRMELNTGDLVPIRPADVHAFHAPTGQSLTLVNVAFSAAVVQQLKEKYFARSAQWPWRRGKLPAMFKLRADQLDEMRRWAELLSIHDPSRLEFDAFVLSLLRMIQPSHARSGSRNQPEPQWLTAALAFFREPAHFPLGPAELSRLCDRSPEHLSRVVRKCYGKTPTDLVNDIRLDFASRQLRMTSRPIVDLALDCGISNLAYFYRLFRRRFATTPRQFRLIQQEVVRRT